MATIAKLVVRLNLDDSQYKKGMDAAINQARGAEKNISGTTKKIEQTTKKSLASGSKSFAGFAAAATVAIGAIVAAATVVVASIAAIGAGLAFIYRGSVGLAREQINVEKQLQAVLTSTGHAAGLTFRELTKMATGLQQVTNFGDEAIIAGQNMLLTFTNIGRDVFPQATETILDMATALGGDAVSNAKMLGMALNDPRTGLTRLTRAGVSFTEQQKAQIITMQQAGDIAGAQALMLAELERQVGGSARAMANPIVQLKNAFNDAKEELGRGVIPVFESLARFVMPLVTGAFMKISQGLGGMVQGLFEVLKGFGRGIASTLGIDMENLGGNMESWGENIVLQLARGMANAIGAVIMVLNQLGQAIAGWLAPGSPPKLLPDLPRWGESAANWFLQGFTNANMSILRDLSGQVESFIRSSMAGQPAQEIAKAVLAARAGLEGALTGGGNLLQSVPQQMQGYVGALLSSQQAAEKLAKAQENLNKITKEYDDQLKPITGRLKEIQAERDAFVQQQRISELEAIAADPNADPNAVKFAQLELEEIALQNEQAAIEENKEIAVNAAQEKVEAAQTELEAAEERLKLEQELLQHQIETNNLLAATIEKMGGVTGATGGASGALGSLAEQMEGIATGIAPGLGASMSEMAKRIKAEFNGVSLMATEMGQTWGTVVDRFLLKAATLKTELAIKVMGILQDFETLKQEVGAVRDFWQTAFGFMRLAIVVTAARVREKATEIQEDLKSKIQDKIEEAKTAWGENVEGMKTLANELADRIRDRFDTIKSNIESAIQPISNFRSALEGLWNWLAGKIFEIRINLPSLPDWAIPGSPIPLHTAMKDFARFLDNADFDIDMAVNGIEAIGQSMLDRTAMAAGPTQLTQPFNMYGNVTNGMDEQVLKSQVQRWVADAMRRN